LFNVYAGDVCQLIKENVFVYAQWLVVCLIYLDYGYIYYYYSHCLLLLLLACCTRLVL